MYKELLFPAAMTHLQVFDPAVSSADQFVTHRALMSTPWLMSAPLRSSLCRGLAQALTLFVFCQWISRAAPFPWRPVFAGPNVEGCGVLALASAFVLFAGASLVVMRLLGDTSALHARMQLAVPQLEPKGD